MSDASHALILKALDGLSARQIATAENIANAGTPGYRPLRVTFEQALTRAAFGGATAVEAVAPRLELAPAAEGPLRLDLELGTSAQTASRYAALIEVLDRQLKLQHLAVTGNA